MVTSVKFLNVMEVHYAYSVATQKIGILFYLLFNILHGVPD